MIAKELRALAPAWVAVAAAMVASSLFRDLRALSVPAYFIGAATLGAFSMGHEYHLRTAGMLFTQPVSRRRVLLTKVGVLAAMLLGLALLATSTVSLGRGEAVFGRIVIWMPVLTAIFITPVLTIVSRSAIGGAVFTLAIAGVLMIAGEWIGISRYGYTREVDIFRIGFVWRTLLILCLAAAAYSWWSFPRLQLVEGHGPALDLPSRTRTSSAAFTRRNPVWLLFRKELRLQQLAFGVAAIYVVLYMAIVTGSRGLVSVGDTAALLTILYAGVLAVVIGSVTSAEERHLQTLDAQLLMPMAASRQWMVKMAVVAGLTVTLALVLPTILVGLLPPERSVWPRNFPWTLAGLRVLQLLSVATLSVFVSTLCSSGLWALLVSIPAAFAWTMFVLTMGRVVEGFLHRLGGRPDWSVVGWAIALATIGMMGLTLRLALGNHRSADRSRRHIPVQVATLAFATIAALAFVGVVGALSR